jgi:antitoxin YefM
MTSLPRRRDDTGAARRPRPNLPARPPRRSPAHSDAQYEVVITRAGHEPVVIVSLDDYESLKETAYLLRSPENVRRLISSIERLESGEGIQRDLAE